MFAIRSVEVVPMSRKEGVAESLDRRENTGVVFTAGFASALARLICESLGNVGVGFDIPAVKGTGRAVP